MQDLLLAVLFVMYAVGMVSYIRSERAYDKRLRSAYARASRSKIALM